MNFLKRAPRWAWYTSAGIAAGAVGIKLWRDRAAPADAGDSATTPDAGTGATGPYVSPSPTPVITPPVIVGGAGNDQADAAGILSAVGGIFGPAFDSMTGLLGTVVTGDQQNIGALITQQGQTSDRALELLASAGQAPQPAAQNPTPITINIPAPVTAPVAAPAGNGCPSAFPHRSARGCYRCTQDSGPNNKKWTHRYQHGAVVGNNDQC